jgi:hypothetical protein
MKKNKLLEDNMKKILSIILAAIMLVTMSFSLVACGGEEQGNQPASDGKVTYTVTVVDENGKPMKGAEITFSPAGSMDIPFDTEDNGTVSYKTAKALTAKLTGIPSGYKSAQLNKDIIFDDNGNATIVLSKMPDFVVKVVYQHDNPVAGVEVQMCDKVCVPYANPTDANGVTTHGYMEGNFHVQLISLPDGYTVDNMEDTYDFIGNEVVIEVTKVN